MKILILLAILLLASSSNGQCVDEYPVAADDTCESIASGSGLSTDQLLAINPGLDCTSLQAGQQICLLAGSLETENNVVSEEEQNPAEAEEEQVPVEEEQNPVEEEQNPAEEQVATEEEQNTTEEVQQPTVSTFAEEVIVAHQVYRDSFESPRLVWNDTLNASSYGWAKELAVNRTAKHSVGLLAFSGYGENIAISQGGFFNSTGYFPFIDTPTNYVNYWGSEWKDFINGTKIFGDAASATGSWYQIGHFTQVIWKTTTSVGCGMYTDEDYTAFVCQYYPPGNLWGGTIY